MNYHLSKNISERTIDGEIFIFERESSHIHTLNKTGAFIYQKLKKRESLRDIAEQICKEFDVSEEQSNSDLQDFINCLTDKKIFYNE